MNTKIIKEIRLNMQHHKSKLEKVVVPKEKTVVKSLENCCFLIFTDKSDCCYTHFLVALWVRTDKQRQRSNDVFQAEKNLKIHGMHKTSNQDERIAKMTFASVYPHYVTKVEKKGRTKEELHQVIEWLTGFDTVEMQKLID